MSQNELEIHLNETLKKLEVAAERIVRTQGFTGESKKIRLLIEMVREQIANENSLSSARPLR
jgi:hypothetical protein